MTDLAQLLETRLGRAFAEVAGEPADPTIRRSDHADFQADGALPLAKKLRRAPREIAADVIAKADLDDLVETAEIAGPGFVNLTVRDDVLGRAVSEMSATDGLGVRPDPHPVKVVLDYSGPNVAKELHVGHLRPTIIGDALARMLEHAGHEVVRQNHLGDWGTQFGMLIQHLVEIGADPSAEGFTLGDLNIFYQEARVAFDGDEAFADRARQRVVRLQRGDPDTLALWRLFMAETERHFQAVYDRFDITLAPEHNVGESAYNDELDSVVDELAWLGLLVDSDGAKCVFPEGFTGRDGHPFPLIVRKRDGGYNYDTTDLAAIRYRLRDLAATRLVYVTDSGQRMHFEMVFQAAREAGWLRAPARAEHLGFGLILGPDRKRLRTRSGEPPKLVDLLDEAIQRAAAVVAEKSPHLEPEEREAVARAVGLGAIKYADLSSDRVKDYVFDLDQMVSFDGNTAPYLQYAHARIRSVFRRGEVDPESVRSADVTVADQAERELALQLGGFEAAIHRSAELAEPHRLCTYLFDLAAAFTHFYETCPVLRADSEAVRTSRLVLCDVTARTLATGLDLLGITAPERM